MKSWVSENKSIKLINGDCLDMSDQIKSGSVDLILTDLPYGTIEGIADSNTVKHGMKGKTDWDIVIDTDKIMKIANRILRKNGKMILFAQQPFTTELINKAIPNLPFNYSMIWEKDHFANALTAKKAPLNYYEDILVFSKKYEKGKNIIPNNPVYHYLQDCKKESGLSIKEFNYLYCDYIGKTKNRHRGMVARCWETSQFWTPNKDIYENVLQPTGFFPLSYSEIEKMDFQEKSTFNLWEGKKYKSNILKYKKDYDGHHPTQKPILLLEDLIKTFSNKGDLVVDLAMGSGSAGVSSKNTARNFIGIELDNNYFDKSVDRIKIL
jgi:site-specific DNA-methyltransferase (adenine-specific)